MCVPVPAGAWAVSVRSARGNSGTLLGSIWSGQWLKVAMSHAIRKGATRYFSFSIRSIFLREAFKKNVEV